ncbi:MAG: hypothetical protein QOG62_1954, partial [Thermoleophilaceae bacterium]|nr:hypothetical protein [Thermoleophilaceae bacterium]
MGVLDDAIREHLELKRQHGASDEELTRAEQDALGPARRDQIEEIDPQAMAEPALVPDHIEPLPHGDPLAHHEPPVGDEAYAPPTEFLPPEEGHDDGMEPEFAPIEGQTEIGEEGAMLAGEPIAEFEAAPEAPYDAATEIHTPEPQTHDAG